MEKGCISALIINMLQSNSENGDIIESMQYCLDNYKNLKKEDLDSLMNVVDLNFDDENAIEMAREIILNKKEKNQMCNGINKKIEDMKKKYTQPIESKLSEVQRNMVELMLDGKFGVSEIADKSGLSEEEVIKIKEDLNK